jgi:cytoskeletal protein CcmA (bactofilin family)
MWFSRRKHPPIRTLIGEGTLVTGELKFSDGLRIDGAVHGEVVADVVAEEGPTSMVVISESARIQGKVRAGHVIINGEVNGRVESFDLLELQPKARITGDVLYENLEMHQGAKIDGELRPLKSAEKPVLKLAAKQS